MPEHIFIQNHNQYMIRKKQYFSIEIDKRHYINIYCNLSKNNFHILKILAHKCEIDIDNFNIENYQTKKKLVKELCNYIHFL
jgi:hypothetical protein